MPLSDYREKYSNLIQVLVSYNIEIYERKRLKEIIEDEYSNTMWHGLVDQFAKDKPKEFKEIENLLHEETAALAFLANSNKQKFGHIIAEPHDDYIKGNNHFPKNMNAMYKLLVEHSWSTTFGVMQASKGKYQGNRQLKCHKCGLANYTVYTCPNCIMNKPNSGRPQNFNGGK